MCVYPTFLLHSKNETYLNGNSHLVKGFSIVIRNVFGFSKYTSYRIRSETLKSMGGHPLEHVTGFFLKPDGSGYPVLVSGHLFNGLLRMQLDTFDVNQYFSHIECNLKGKFDSFSIEGRDASIQWHSYIEYIIALKSVESFLLSVNIPPTIPLDYLISRFKSIGSKNHKFFSPSPLARTPFSKERPNLSISSHYHG